MLTKTQIDEMEPLLGDVRRQTERIAGTRIPNADWRRLIAQHDIVLDPPMDDVSIRQAIKVLEGWREADAMTDGPRSAEVTVRPEDARFDALTEIFALEAAESSEVQDWRARYLGGQLLHPDEVTPWIVGRLSKEPSERVVILVIRTGHDSIPIGTDNLGLPYVRSDGRHVWERVSYTGTLGELRLLAHSQARKFHWNPAEATNFLLTGQPPTPVFVRAELCAGEGPATSRVVMTVDPRASWKTIAQAYGQLLANQDFQSVSGLNAVRADKSRVAVPGNRKAPRSHSRALSPHSALLAVFVARNHRLPWSQLMAKWNREHAGRPYTDQRTFARDARHAWSRVIGTDFFVTSKWRDDKAGDAPMVVQEENGAE